jgi:hypothetical protein
MNIQIEINEIDFDLTLDDSDEYNWGDNQERENYHQLLRNQYIGRIYEIEVEDDDDIDYQLCEIISSDSGWCLNSIRYEKVS